MDGRLNSLLKKEGGSNFKKTFLSEVPQTGGMTGGQGGRDGDKEQSPRVSETGGVHNARGGKKSIRRLDCMARRELSQQQKSIKRGK